MQHRFIELCFILSFVSQVYFSASTELGRCSAGVPNIEPVTSPVVHGEGPHWDPRTQVLYFVDISNQTVNRFKPSDGSHSAVYIDGGPVSPVIPTRKDGWFVIGRGLDLVLINWDGLSSSLRHIKVLTSVDRDKPGNRFNDGKADASGRLWVGTMGPEDPELKKYQGALYSFDIRRNFAPMKHVSRASVSNGLGWSKNDTLMYYIDSPTRNVDVFDFDLQSGVIKNRRTVFSLEQNAIDGFPDGMAVDADDNIWVAVYAGGAVLHIDPLTGTLLHKIDFPVSLVTSCAFGGPGLSTLYVTTSQRGFDEAQLAAEPFAGSVFAVTGLGVKGQRKTNTASTYAVPKLKTIN